jgi:hypothetical protein
LNGAKKEIEDLGGAIGFIGQATPRHAAHFRRRYAPDISILADDDRESYKALGLKRATRSQLIGPKSVMKGFARGATSGVGVGRVIGDVAQLGATLIVMPDGSIAWSHLSRDASDNATVPEVLEALSAATDQGGKR